MRTIAKGGEPRSLIEHRMTRFSNYDNYADKDDLRHSLVAEQQGLCCYCMGRIRCESNSMKIEHWHCQDRYPDGQLNYRNLLGACLGGKGRPSHLQHCDTKKGDHDFLLNPADRTHHIETWLHYEANGSIRSDNIELDTQLDEVLNLNIAFLKNNRKGVLDSVLEWWRQNRPMSRDRIKRERDRWINGTGDLEPYCQVAVWWLEQRLAERRS